jgi:hypothetical protein
MTYELSVSSASALLGADIKSGKKKAKAIAKQGRLIRYETGEYSDYRVIGFFAVLESFVPQEALAEYLTINPMQKDKFYFESDEFLSFLIKKGLLLEVDHGVWHVGDYGDSASFNFQE